MVAILQETASTTSILTSAIRMKHTHHPWLSIDLGASRQVDWVQIHNRKDCCWSRLKNFEICALSPRTIMHMHTLWPAQCICCLGTLLCSGDNMNLTGLRPIFVAQGSAA